MIFKTVLLSVILFLAFILSLIFFKVEFIRKNLVVQKTYGLNDIGLRLRATWIDPFATDMDPRSLLILGANEIDRFELNNSISEEMKSLWEDPFSPKYNLRDLMKKGADEIDRLEAKNKK